MRTQYKVIPPELGRWYWGVRLNDDWQRMEPFTKVLEVDCFRLKRLPPEAIELKHGEDYDGIRFKVRFKIPARIERWR